MATVIFLCNEDIYPEIRQVIEEAKQDISHAKAPIWTWTFGNVQKLEVGEKVYFKRVGNGNRGFFAAGHTIAGEEYEQLRLQHRAYVHLSETYIIDFEGTQRIKIKIESVVDYDFGLLEEDLKKNSKFKGVNFIFMQSGCEFSPEHVTYLDSEWEKHSMELTRKGRGQRLVDVFFDRGLTHKKNGDLNLAIEAFNKALEIDPKYSKAINFKNTCERILNRKFDRDSEQEKDDPKITEVTYSVDSTKTNNYSDQHQGKEPGNTNEEHEQPELIIPQTVEENSSNDFILRGASAERIGREGEKLVNQYFSILLEEGKVKKFHWKASEVPNSPYDFYFQDLDGLDILVDVKSTSGAFETSLYVSLNELKEMVCAQRYDIYRIYSLDEAKKTAKMRISKSVKEFARSILEVFELLPNHVSVDTISVKPSSLKFDQEIIVSICSD